MTNQAEAQLVEVRTWPERSDLLVIDVKKTWVLAHYALDDSDSDLDLFDPAAPYQTRLDQALSALERDQEYLQAFYASRDKQIKLEATDTVRGLLETTLADYDLDLEKIALPNLRKSLAELSALPVDNYYKLLCDWHDVVERHYPAGSSLKEENSWVHRAAPDKACHFHYLATGVEDRNQATEADTADAYQLFRSLVDIPLDSFTFGHALRWSYFHKTEFSNYEQPFELKALTEAGV